MVLAFQMFSSYCDERIDKKANKGYMNWVQSNFKTNFLRIISQVFFNQKQKKVWPEAKHSTFYFYEALWIISTLLRACIKPNKVCADILHYKDILWNGHTKQLKTVISRNTHCIITLIICNLHSVSNDSTLV